MITWSLIKRLSLEICWPIYIALCNKRHQTYWELAKFAVHLMQILNLVLLSSVGQSLQIYIAPLDVSESEVLFVEHFLPLSMTNLTVLLYIWQHCHTALKSHKKFKSQKFNKLKSDMVWLVLSFIHLWNGLFTQSPITLPVSTAQNKTHQLKEVQHGQLLTLNITRSMDLTSRSSKVAGEKIKKKLVKMIGVNEDRVKCAVANSNVAQVGGGTVLRHDLAGVLFWKKIFMQKYHKVFFGNKRSSTDCFISQTAVDICPDRLSTWLSGKVSSIGNLRTAGADRLTLSIGFGSQSFSLSIGWRHWELNCDLAIVWRWLSEYHCTCLCWRWYRLMSYYGTMHCAISIYGDFSTIRTLGHACSWCSQLNRNVYSELARCRSMVCFGCLWRAVCSYNIGYWRHLHVHQCVVMVDVRPS